MGPELTRIGDKVRRDWLFSYLKDPHRVQPDTPMLQYRLTDDQLRDLTAFLFEEIPVGRYRRRAGTPLLVHLKLRAAGRAVFERRGCASCHRLAEIKAPGASGQVWPASRTAIPMEPQCDSNLVRHTTDNYIFLKVLKPDTLGQPSLMQTESFTPSKQPGSPRRSPASGNPICRRHALSDVRSAAPYRPGGAFGELMTRYGCLRLSERRRIRRRPVHRAPRSDWQSASARLPGEVPAQSRSCARQRRSTHARLPHVARRSEDDRQPSFHRVSWTTASRDTTHASRAAKARARSGAVSAAADAGPAASAGDDGWLCRAKNCRPPVPG